MSTRPLAQIVALALIVLVTSCAQPPIKRYYTLRNDSDRLRPPGSLPLCHRQIVVESVETAAPYDIEDIVYRSGGFEIKHFNYEYWVSPPRDMFTELLTTRLEREGMFESVQMTIHAGRDYLGLLASVAAIELIAEDNKLEARLAMTLRLRDTKTDRMIWEHHFDTVQPVHGKRFDVEDTVRTLSAVYNAELRSSLKLLSGFLPSYEGCAKPQKIPDRIQVDP